MAFYDKCEMVVQTFEKTNLKAQEMLFYIEKWQAKANRLGGLIKSLKPEFPAVKQIDFALYNEIIAACPFIAPFLPINPANQINSALNSLRSGLQSQLDDAFNAVTEGPLDKLAGVVDKLNTAVAPVKALIRQYINIMNAITTCLDKLCDLTTAETYKKQVDDWKTWLNGNDEEAGAFEASLTNAQKQFMAKKAALDEWANPGPKWESPNPAIYSGIGE